LLAKVELFSRQTMQEWDRFAHSDLPNFKGGDNSHVKKFLGAPYMSL